jgi:hypothetical protein
MTQWRIGGVGLALLLGALVAPSAMGAVEPCAQPVERIALAGGWMRTDRDGVATYRRAGANEAVTAAVYELAIDLVTEPQRLAAALRAVALERKAERRLGSSRLELSATVRQQVGKDWHICHTGFDAAADRRFVSRTVVGGRYLQHFYYEARGSSRPAFAQSAARIFAASRGAGGSRLRDATRVTAPVMTGAAPLLVAPGVPGLARGR